MTCRANFVVSCGLTFGQKPFSSFYGKRGVLRVVKGLAGVILAERERTT